MSFELDVDALHTSPYALYPQDRRQRAQARRLQAWLRSDLRGTPRDNLARCSIMSA
ncbi:hypothetical protein [Duganella lactea]|uniref:hypothetical protein n=1 Tax=Duganella lactea TaxID=2692173 RepID=UPI001E4271E0|nr:hypothetical protein [Duganella lactea]